MTVTLVQGLVIPQSLISSIPLITKQTGAMPLSYHPRYLNDEVIELGNYYLKKYRRAGIFSFLKRRKIETIREEEIIQEILEKIIIWSIVRQSNEHIIVDATSVLGDLDTKNKAITQILSLYLDKLSQMVKSLQQQVKYHS